MFPSQSASSSSSPLYRRLLLQPDHAVSPVVLLGAFPLSFELSAACPGRSRSVILRSLSPFLATLTSTPQLTENTTTLSLVFATLTDCVRHKSFICHSCKKTPGVGIPSREFSQISGYPLLTTRCRPETMSTPGRQSSYRARVLGRCLDGRNS